jgi:hypothetical protein
MADNPFGSSTGMSREVVELDRAEAMRLLASVPYGRVVFTQEALPAIRPVNHLVDNDRIILRTRLTAKISTALGSRPNPGVVVAYEADDLDDSATPAGVWSLLAWRPRSPALTRSPATSDSCIHGSTKPTR